MTNTIKYPFNRTTLGEKPKLDTFTVRLNDKERELLNKAKKDLDINADSTTLKELAFVGLNVLQTLFLMVN